MNYKTHVNWEFYKRVNLISPVSVVRKPLEVDHKDLWQTPQVKLLGGLLVLLAVRTVPGKKNKMKEQSRTSCSHQASSAPSFS